MIIRTLLALMLAMAGSSAVSAGDEFVTLVVGSKGSPFPPMLRPPGDTGLSGAQVIGRNFQRLGTRIVDEGGRSTVKTEYREGDWTLEVASSTPRGMDRIDRSFTIGSSPCTGLMSRADEGKCAVPVYVQAETRFASTRMV